MGTVTKASLTTLIEVDFLADCQVTLALTLALTLAPTLALALALTLTLTLTASPPWS